MQATVLGTAQDGGVPHLGCDCDRCQRARDDSEYVRYPTALLVEADGDRLLVDATTDVRHQVRSVDALCLTHAHVGHLSGVLQFGPEVVDADALPVYCTAGMAELLRENAPFSTLVDDGNVDLRVVGDGDALDWPGTEAGEVRVHRVPHRDEHGTGTLAVTVEAEDRLCYLPDLDEWTAATVELVADSDVALVDGTVWSDAELPRQAEVAHPPIEESLDRLPASTDVRFTHLNHTNPVLDQDSRERAAVTVADFDVAERGTVLDL